jgi:hypothetical protein
MTIYSKMVNAAAVGATANTFDNVGTITLRSDARKLLGFWVEAAPAVYTAAEAISGQLRISSSDLGLGQQVATCPPYQGGGPATNGIYTNHPAEFIPCVCDAKGKEQITVDFSSNLPDPTAACSVVVAAMYDAGKSSSLGQESLRSWPEMAPICKGFTNQATAAVTTVAETAMTAMTIPAWAKKIVGIKCGMIPNLMTAGEERVGFVRFRSTIPDFEPMEIPFRTAIGAALGTPVGGGANPQNMAPMAVDIPLTGNTETITPYAVLNVAVTTGDPVFTTIYYQ